MNKKIKFLENKIIMYITVTLVCHLSFHLTSDVTRTFSITVIWVYGHVVYASKEPLIIYIIHTFKAIQLMEKRKFVSTPRSNGL